MVSQSKFKIEFKNEAIVEDPQDALNAMKQMSLNLKMTPSVSTLKRKGWVETSNPLTLPYHLLILTRLHPSPSSNRTKNSITAKNDRRVSFSEFDSPVIGSAILTQPQATNTLAFQSSAATNGSTSSMNTVSSSAPLSISTRVCCVETINVLLKSGKIEKVLLTGEVSFEIASLESILAARLELGQVRLRIQHHRVIEKMVPNDGFATLMTDDSNLLDSFTDVSVHLDRYLLSSLSSVVVFKYQVGVTEQNASLFAPLYVSPVWKIEENLTSLMVVYQFNDKLNSSNNNTAIILKDLAILVTCAKQNEESDVVFGSAQLLPAGLWNPQRGMLLWKIPDTETLAMQQSGSAMPIEPVKLFARFETPGAQMKAGAVAVKFSIDGSLLSGINISLLPTSESRVQINMVEFVKRTNVGKYGAFEN